MSIVLEFKRIDLFIEFTAHSSSACSQFPDSLPAFRFVGRRLLRFLTRERLMARNWIKFLDQSNCQTLKVFDD